MYGQFAVLFGMLFTGYFLRRANFIDDKMNHGLNKFIVYFAYPCLITQEIGSLKMTTSLALEFILMFGASLACFAIYCAWAFVYGKARRFPRDVSGVAEFAMVSPNNGFMGFSIASVFFGSEAFFLMIAHSSALNFLFFSYGLYLLHRDRGTERKKACTQRNPQLYHDNNTQYIRTVCQPLYRSCYQSQIQQNRIQIPVRET